MFGKLSFEETSSGGLCANGTIADAGLKSLRQAKIDLTRWVRSAQDRLHAKGRGGSFTDAERANFQSVSSYLADVGVTLAQRERENETDRSTASVNDADAEASRRAATRSGIIRRGAADAGGPGRPTGPLFGQMFPQAGASLDGWESGAEFCHVIGHGLHDQRLRAASQTGSIGSSGGFAVPPGVLGPWLDLALEAEIVRPRSAVWPIIVGRERLVPAWDVSDRSSGIAGLTINWEPEAPDTDPDVQVAKMRLLTLHARRGAIFAEASNELEGDGLDFQSQMNTIMTRAIAFGLDQVFLLTGTGANQPQSIFNSLALIAVTRTTANLILYEDLLAMFSRTSPASIPNSVWVAHSSTIPQLASLSIAVGTGGSAVPVLTESNGQFKILTRPVIFSEKVRPLGQLSDIGLFDFSQYVIGMRMDATLDKSQHVGFKRNVMTYRLQLRIDGMPNIDHPYQPPNSAATQSPFVALAA